MYWRQNDSVKTTNVLNLFNKYILFLLSGRNRWDEDTTDRQTDWSKRPGLLSSINYHIVYNKNGKVNVYVGVYVKYG